MSHRYDPADWAVIIATIIALALVLYVIVGEGLLGWS